MLYAVCGCVYHTAKKLSEKFGAKLIGLDPTCLPLQYCSTPSKTGPEGNNQNFVPSLNPS